MHKKIIFDASVLVTGMTSNKLHKTGLYRFSFEILRELSIKKDLDIYLFDVYLRERELVKYVHENFSNCKRIYIYSAFFRKFIFILGDLIDAIKIKENKHGKSNANKIQKFIFSHIIKLFKKFELKSSIEKRVNQQIRKFSSYFSTYFPIPDFIRRNPNIKKIQTIHDMIPIFHPEYFSSSYNEIILKEVVNNITKADKVVAVSKSTKSDILKYRPDLTPANILVSLEAASDIFYKESNLDAINSIRNKYRIKDKTYFLSLCTLEPRKNLSIIVDAFHHFLQDDQNVEASLVLTGSYGWDLDSLLEKIKDINKNFNDKIILTGYVEDKDLAPLYSGAMAFIYASLYEGFGLPLLEAMKCGTPVISSNNSSLPEVGGDAALYISGNDVYELKSALMNIINHRTNDMLREKVKIRADKFNWHDSAERINNIL